MNREDIQKLLGGYGTGTLTPDEERALFAAALEDQELFDALGREQALRDLLRDPAAKAQLLAALDTPERSSFWKWLARPLVAGFATAGVTAIAVLAVWQGTRLKPLPRPTVIAELKRAEPGPPQTRTIESKPADTRSVDARSVDARSVDARSADTKAAPDAVAKRKEAFSSLRDSNAANPPAAPARQRDQAVAQEAAKKEIAPAAPAPLPAAPPPPPALAPGQPAGERRASVAESVEIQATAPLNTSLDQVRQDARSLFYGNGLLPRKDALAPPVFGTGGVAAGVGGVTGGAPPANAPKAASAQMRSGNLAAGSALFALGVRVSLLRGSEEAAVTTFLEPGEPVRLKLTPNEDGFLYVAARDGDTWKMVASGPAQRLKPFETPALSFTGSGQKQLYVMLSRQARTLSPESLAGLARANLVETVAGQDRATYVVADMQNVRPQQVVQPIVLTYR